MGGPESPDQWPAKLHQHKGHTESKVPLHSESLLVALLGMLGLGSPTGTTGLQDGQRLAIQLKGWECEAIWCAAHHVWRTSSSVTTTPQDQLLPSMQVLCGPPFSEIQESIRALAGNRVRGQRTLAIPLRVMLQHVHVGNQVLGTSAALARELHAGRDRVKETLTSANVQGLPPDKPVVLTATWGGAHAQLQVTRIVLYSAGRGCSVTLVTLSLSIDVADVPQPVGTTSGLWGTSSDTDAQGSSPLHIRKEGDDQVVIEMWCEGACVVTCPVAWSSATSHTCKDLMRSASSGASSAVTAAVSAWNEQMVLRTSDAGSAHASATMEDIGLASALQSLWSGRSKSQPASPPPAVLTALAALAEHSGCDDVRRSRTLHMSHAAYAADARKEWQRSYSSPVMGLLPGAGRSGPPVEGSHLGFQQEVKFSGPQLLQQAVYSGPQVIHSGPQLHYGDQQRRAPVRFEESTHDLELPDDERAAWPRGGVCVAPAAHGPDCVGVAQDISPLRGPSASSGVKPASRGASTRSLVGVHVDAGGCSPNLGLGGSHLTSSSRTHQSHTPARGLQRADMNQGGKKFVPSTADMAAHAPPHVSFVTKDDPRLSSPFSTPSVLVPRSSMSAPWTDEASGRQAGEVPAGSDRTAAWTGAKSEGEVVFRAGAGGPPMASSVKEGVLSTEAEGQGKRALTAEDETEPAHNPGGVSWDAEWKAAWEAARATARGAEKDRALAPEQDRALAPEKDRALAPTSSQQQRAAAPLGVSVLVGCFLFAALALAMQVWLWGV